MSLSDQIDRMLDDVYALDGDQRTRLLARIVGVVAAGGAVDVDEFRHLIVGLPTTTATTPGVADPSSQAGLASFVHLRNEPGDTTTGS